MARVAFRSAIFAVFGILGGAVACPSAWGQASDPDLNNDGIVNIFDVSIVGSCFGADLTALPQCVDADTDGDGDVDMDDVNFVVVAFGQTGFPTEDTIAPIVSINEPANLSLSSTSPIAVSGTVDDSNPVTVTVNGVAANVTGNTWDASVSLKEGNNVLTAVAEDEAGNVATASIQVTLDTQPPTVTIDSPPDGFVTNQPTVTVAGMINDIVVGTVNGDQAQVTVNGIAAQVANRSYLVEAVPLVPGANTITAVGEDKAGNVAEAQIIVQFEEIVAESMIELVSGNNQTGPIGAELTEPLVVALKDGLGSPVPNETVIFKVTESNGTLSGSPEGVRALVITSDAQGRASVRWTLGTRAGAGNNVVEATSVGFAGSAFFTATALPSGAAKINVDAGNNQVGAAGEPLPRPFIAVVTDDGNNRLGNVPITFTVLQGGGSFEGFDSLTVNTDSDGRALATLTLGFQEGVDNNVVEADFPDNPGLAASFVASGRVAGNPANTSVSGVVLDNVNEPVSGVTMRIDGTNLAAQTDEQGQFSILSAPVGHVLLIADGSTADRPGTWPSLEFDLVTVSGQDNTLGMPIFLLPLDLPNALFVDDTTGGTLTLPDVPGFALTVEPDSTTFPDASRSGVVSVTVVHADKIPMVPNFGQQPRFIVTIQPAGVVFDPPAPLTIPNVDGLAPGEVTEMYSFDHDLGQFVSIGSGTVSDDGTVIASDPGIGIIKGGWHCGGNPVQTGSCCNCELCERCSGNMCVPRPNGSLLPNDKCKQCRDGGPVDVDLAVPTTDTITLGLPTPAVDKINEGLDKLRKIGILLKYTAKQLTGSKSIEECCEPDLGKGRKETATLTGTLANVEFAGKIWPPGPIPDFKSPEFNILVARVKFEASFVGGLFVTTNVDISGTAGSFKDQCSRNPKNQAGCFQAEAGLVLDPGIDIRIEGDGCLLVQCLGCSEFDKICANGGAMTTAQLTFNIANLTFNKPNCGDSISGGVATFGGATFKIPITFGLSGKINGVAFNRNKTFEVVTCDSNSDPYCQVNVL